MTGRSGARRPRDLNKKTGSVNKVNSRGETPEQEMARRRREEYAPTRDIVSRAKDWTAIATAVIITVTIVTAILSYSGRVLDSGPMPFPSRLEVDGVSKSLKELDDKDDKIHQSQLDQLKQLADQQQRLSAEQRIESRDRLAARLSSLQSAIDTAKAIYDKDGSVANERYATNGGVFMPTSASFRMATALVSIGVGVVL